MSAFVYMMVADVGIDHRYCKIGVTRSLKDRVRAVQVSCPVVISDLAYVRVPRADSAFLIEREIHRELASYQSQGEWFRLNFSSEGDKRAFHGAASKVLNRRLGTAWRWVHVSMDALDYIDVAACV